MWPWWPNVGGLFVKKNRFSQGFPRQFVPACHLYFLTNVMDWSFFVGSLLDGLAGETNARCPATIGVSCPTDKCKLPPTMGSVLRRFRTGYRYILLVCFYAHISPLFLFPVMSLTFYFRHIVPQSPSPPVSSDLGLKRKSSSHLCRTLIGAGTWHVWAFSFRRPTIKRITVYAYLASKVRFTQTILDYHGV